LHTAASLQWAAKLQVWWQRTYWPSGPEISCQATQICFSQAKPYFSLPTPFQHLQASALSARKLASHSLAIDIHQHVSGLCAVLVSVTAFQSSQCLAMIASLAAMHCFKTPQFLAQRPSTSMTKLRSPCRCQASDSNGKPGMLFGLKNPFRGLKFGNQASDEESTKAEQESQQQLAADKAQPIGNGMPWRAWKQVLHL